MRASTPADVLVHDRAIIFSVIIPVFDRQSELGVCLAALRDQRVAPPFEIIVVDDGSKVQVPAPSARGPGEPAIQVIRQRNSGPAAARNTGISAASGEVLLFLDSDVIGDRNLLSAIAECARDHPRDVAFQVRLASTANRVSDRMENARLAAIQRMQTRADGSIGYVNTSAFAVRASYAAQSAAFFNPRVSRGEDTLILARLKRDGLLPCFLPSAIAYHHPPGALARYISRHFRIGYRTREARTQLSKSAGMALSWPDRLRMLRHIMENSGGGVSGGIVSALVLLAYGLEVAGRAASSLESLNLNLKFKGLCTLPYRRLR